MILQLNTYSLCTINELVEKSCKSYQYGGLEGPGDATAAHGPPHPPPVVAAAPLALPGPIWFTGSTPRACVSHSRVTGNLYDCGRLQEHLRMTH